MPRGHDQGHGEDAGLHVRAQCHGPRDRPHGGQTGQTLGGGRGGPSAEHGRPGSGHGREGRAQILLNTFKKQQKNHTVMPYPK